MTLSEDSSLAIFEFCPSSWAIRQMGTVGEMVALSAIDKFGSWWTHKQRPGGCGSEASRKRLIVSGRVEENERRGCYRK